MEKYVKLLEVVNNKINDFNNYLKPEFNIDIIKTNELENKKLFTDIANTPWNDQDWSIYAKTGVYFILGYNRANKEQLGMYIGKASLNSEIGKRLYSHLQKHKDEQGFYMNDLEGNTFTLEFVAHISLEDKDLIFMHPAIEEYLIVNLRDKIHLLNGTGN